MINKLLEIEREINIEEYNLKYFSLEEKEKKLKIDKVKNLKTELMELRRNLNLDIKEINFKSNILKCNFIYEQTKDKIKNIPTKKMFYNKANRIIVENILEITNFLNNESNNTHMYKHEISSEYFESIVANIHLASELYLKGIICNISPFLLLEDKSINNLKIDFLKLKTIGAEQLIGRAKTIIYKKESNFFKNSFNIDFIKIYEKNRNDRNSFMHSINNFQIEDLLPYLFQCFGILEIFNKKSNLSHIIYKHIYSKEINKENIKLKHEEYYDCHPDIGIIKYHARGKYINFFHLNIWQRINLKIKKAIFNFDKNINNQDEMFFCSKCYLTFLNYNNIVEFYYENKDTLLSFQNKKYLSLVDFLRNDYRINFYKTSYTIKHKHLKSKCFICGNTENLNDSLVNDILKKEPFNGDFIDDIPFP